MVIHESTASVQIGGKPRWRGRAGPL